MPIIIQDEDFGLKSNFSWPTVAESLIRIACLVVEIAQSCFLCRATLSLHRGQGQGQGHRTDRECISHS